MKVMSKAKFDEHGRKICSLCGKVDGDVKFTETKNECNVCRSLKVADYENTPARLFILWKPRNEEKSKIFLRGNADPCVTCNFASCYCCVVYHAKMKYLDPKEEETRLFVKDFTKNLLENLKRVAKVG